MILIFFFFIVFMAEMVLAIFAISYLIKFDKALISADNFLLSAKPNIIDIAKILKGLSEQFLEFSPIVAEKLQEIKINILFGIVEKLFSPIILLGLNSKLSRKIKLLKRIK